MTEPAAPPPKRKKRRILMFILLDLLALIVILVIVIALQPSEYRVARSLPMVAPPADVFAQVNDFHRWDAWSPWAKLDPNMKTTFSGETSGKGAAYSWVGNKDVGEGRMTIIESRPNDLVRVNLEFLKPFASTALTDFTFKPQGDKTLVTWTMTGHNNFIGKAFCLFMSMDKMIGGDFEKGLAAMKSVVERPPATTTQGK